MYLISLSFFRFHIILLLTLTFNLFIKIEKNIILNCPCNLCTITYYNLFNMNTFDVSSNNSETEWVTISTRRFKSPTIVFDITKTVSYEQLVEVLKTELYKYESNIVAGYIYGSRARGTNRINSDADILIFWKKEMTIEDLQMIRTNIEISLGFDIDFVSCVFAGKIIDYPDERDIAYFENVVLDAKQFIGHINSIQWLSECSKKCKKLQ